MSGSTTACLTKGAYDRWADDGLHSPDSWHDLVTCSQGADEAVQMIRAYPRHPSLLPGAELTLHVSTDQPGFIVDFYRVGRGLEGPLPLVAHTLQGHNYPPGPTDQDWGWPGYVFPIPVDWRPGCYIAVLSTVRSDGTRVAPDVASSDGLDSKALFVIKNPNPGRDTKILYKLSWATFHAYNTTGYGSLYQEAVWSPRHPEPGFKVTTRRPGGGTGGVIMMGDSPDFYDRGSRRQTFAHWDQPFIKWLDENNYLVDYCTDLDLHQDEALLRPYNLLLSVGHDEYWSSAMRARIDDFVNSGGNVAYFSGNIDGWQIHFHDNDTAIVCAKLPPSPSAPTASVASADDSSVDWVQDSNQATNPENRTTGVSYYLGGGWWDGKRETLGYTVQHAEHWVYTGTGLFDGSIFGDDEDLPLVGYECDGAFYQIRDGYAFATGVKGTPSTFYILGLARLGSGWHTFRSGAAATMGTFTSVGGGIVFQGATTDWPMSVPRNRTVAAITRNVLNRLSLRSVRILGPLPGYAGRMLAAAGDIATFVADGSTLPMDSKLTYEWQASGSNPIRSDSPTFSIAVPSRRQIVTVSLTVSNQSRAIAFGTRTFEPMSQEDSLRLEIVTLIREIAIPGDPSGSFVGPTSDPVLVSRGIATVNLPSIHDKANRLAKITAELLELWAKDGTRPIVADPRERWTPTLDG